MTNFLITPADLVAKAMNVKGFRDVYLNEGIEPKVVLEVANDIATEWANDWEEGEGFGSSDATYMVRHFIQDVLIYGGVSDRFQVDFTPYLEVVAYSEAAQDAKELEMEIGG